MLIRFWKPFNVLCQFTDQENRSTLADFIELPGVYAAGRLDKDSEGLLLLTDHGPTATSITSPKFEKLKTYWVQVEGIPSEQAIESLRNGVRLKDGMTKPANVEVIGDPLLPPREPTIRFRANIPTTWISIIISEGKNRQVRRMTAAVGHPTLRLVRWSIGEVTLEGLQPGKWEEI
jgi:23S rRNA pseudouridine2457 synthase